MLGRNRPGISQVKVKPIFVALVLLGFFAGGAEAASRASTGKDKQLSVSARKSVSISNNSGGVVVKYALKTAQFRRAGTLVKFSGRCDSACTLFLGLPRNQTCISPGAYFRFHAPSARSSRSARMAKSYMMSKYPGWVQSWIRRKGGLSTQLVTMDYAYASRFVSTCGKVALAY